MSEPHGYFKKGAEVEISSNDDGFRGAWYSGTVVRPATSRSKTGKILVEYSTLTSDDAGTRPLRELVDPLQLRPPAPRERSRRKFEFSEEVDAWYSDGWWEGVVTEVPAPEEEGEGMYGVFFRGTREQLRFKANDLRVHREWGKGGVWAPPLEEKEGDDNGEQKLGSPEVSIVVELNHSKEPSEDKFSEGMLVEVSSDEDGFQGAWFVSTVIKKLRGNKYLIEYKSLRNDDDTALLREQADSLHIRPLPPETVMVDRFNLHEEVDALYNDGWWVGVITKVFNDGRYMVYFRGTDEEMKFNHPELRIHHEWIKGKWHAASQALKS